MPSAPLSLPEKSARKDGSTLDNGAARTSRRQTGDRGRRGSAAAFAFAFPAAVPTPKVDADKAVTGGAGAEPRWKRAGDGRIPAEFSVFMYARLPLAALLAGLVLLVTLLWVRLCDLRLGVRGFCNGANCT